jgi:hypothetical protein
VYIQTFYVHAKFHDFFNGPGKKTILISKIATHNFFCLSCTPRKMSFFAKKCV